MTPLRTKLAALGLVAAIVSATGGSVLAHALHSVCVAQQHDCGKTARISNCCGHQGAAWSDATPAQSRVEVRAGLSPMPGLPRVFDRAPARQAAGRIPVLRPGLCLLDLPTLFCTFLI